MTRAKDELHLIAPQRFYAHQQPSFADRHVYASRTRFIPDAILDCFEPVTWPLAQAEQGTLRSSIIETLDLKARMRGMWR